MVLISEGPNYMENTCALQLYTNPKKEGRLGPRRILKLNYAFMIKLGWEAITSNSL